MRQPGEAAGKIGVISDTHGLVREEVARVFAGVDLIIHAGDVVKKEVLLSLERIAPVVAVRGNMDKEEWSKELPETQVVEEGGVKFLVIHDAEKLDVDPEAAGMDVVVCGHTHRPEVKREGGVLYVNPGSCGPDGFKPTYTVAVVTLGDEVEAHLVNLREV
jgi:hypothetical protein